MVTSTSLPLFPIPVCLYNYGEENHELNVDLVTDTISEMSKDPEGHQRSNFGGWHSKGDLEIRYASFNVLKNKIQESCDNYCDRYGFQKGLKIGKLWSNMNYTGDMNVGHHHTNSALTGVYYPVKYIVDNTCEFNYSEGNPLQPGIWDGSRGGSIYFQDPNYGLKFPRLRKIKKPTAYNLDAYYTYPVSGLLIVFPSYLIHTVTPFKENLQRLSISFTANYGTS
tara:strand:- start:892 stop:1563 length:672 start_codon:yes stop_codon:yes gene_type:complete